MAALIFLKQRIFMYWDISVNEINNGKIPHKSLKVANFEEEKILSTFLMHFFQSEICVQIATTLKFEEKKTIIAPVFQELKA